MGVDVMMTKAYELTDDISNLMKVDNEEYIYDDRLRMFMPAANLSVSTMFTVYKNYVGSFCELINRDPSCKLGQYTACGFLPVGIEPLCLCNKVTRDFIIPFLREVSVDYFLLKPMSPIYSGYRPQSIMAANHDVWVNKLDAAKIVKKPIHNITSRDVLEVILG